MSTKAATKTVTEPLESPFVAQSPVPWHLMKQKARQGDWTKYGTPNLDGKHCLGVTSKKNSLTGWCTQKARKNLSPNWLWCGKCTGHLLLVSRYLRRNIINIVPPSPESSVESNTDIVKSLFEHPDRRLRNYTAKRCEVSLVTSELAATILENEPKLAKLIAYHTDPKTKLPANLLSYITTTVIPPDSRRNGLFSDHPPLKAVILLRSNDTWQQEQQTITQASSMSTLETLDNNENADHIDGTEFVLTDSVEAEKLLRQTSSALQSTTPNLTPWLQLLACSSKTNEKHLQQQRVNNLFHLMQAAQSVANSEISATEQLSPNEALWATMLLRLLQHASETCAQVIRFGKNGKHITELANYGYLEHIVVERTDQNLLHIHHNNKNLDQIIQIAVTSCELFMQLTRKMPENVGRAHVSINRTYSCSIHSKTRSLLCIIPCVGLAAYTAIDNKNQSHVDTVRQLIVDIYLTLWRYIVQVKQQVVPYEYERDRQEVQTAIQAIKLVGRVGYDVWESDNIENLVTYLLQISSYNNKLDEFPIVTLEYQLRQLCQMSETPQNLGKLFVDTGQHKWRYMIIQLDNLRDSYRTALLTDDDWRRLSRSTSLHQLYELTESKRLPVDVIDRLVTKSDVNIKLRLLKEQSNISKATLTIVAFDRNITVAQVAAERLKTMQD